MVSRFTLVLPLLALAACDMPPAPAQPPVTVPPAPATCGADSYKGLIGKPKSALAGIALPTGSRVIGPGDAVTMDYRTERLNIEIGKSGLIEKIACY